MKTGILYTLLFCTVSTGFIGWRVHASKNQQARHVAILGDLSLSHTEGCASLVGLAEQVLRDESVPANTRLTVLVPGDETTANEPSLLGKYTVPKSRRVVEGRNANARRRQELLHDIAIKCEHTRGPTISPLFLGMKQAIADLRAQGCAHDSDCQLYVSSDMEENVELSIQRKLNGSTDKKATLPSPVNNNGISVSVCGLAARAGRIVDGSGREIRKATPQDPGRDDRFRQVWLSLFTRPELVEFAPYCPQSGDLQP